MIHVVPNYALAFAHHDECVTKIHGKTKKYLTYSYTVVSNHRLLIDVTIYYPIFLTRFSLIVDYNQYDYNEKARNLIKYSNSRAYSVVTHAARCEFEWSRL